jgi:hypothetical protein
MTPTTDSLGLPFVAGFCRPDGHSEGAAVLDQDRGYSCQHQFFVDYAAPRIGLTTASICTVVQYTAQSAIKAARLPNCEPR